MDARKQDEVNFHDQRERVRLSAADVESFYEKYPNKSFYAINGQVKRAIRDWMIQNCPGAVGLDYCCGLGVSTLEMASNGATVHAIDISPAELATAEKRAKEAGVGDKTTFYRMDAEDMEFTDGFFDIIICNGVLHHLDLAKSYCELARVLKPGGQIICIEAQGTNPLINWYRRRTPKLRTAWEIDHILTLRQVHEAKQHFEGIDIKYYHLSTIAAIPFRRTPFFRPILFLCEQLDRLILKAPVLQRLAWQMIFVLTGPRPVVFEPRAEGDA